MNKNLYKIFNIKTKYMIKRFLKVINEKQLEIHIFGNNNSYNPPSPRQWKYWTLKCYQDDMGSIKHKNEYTRNNYLKMSFKNSAYLELKPDLWLKRKITLKIKITIWKRKWEDKNEINARNSPKIRSQKEIKKLWVE